MFFIPSSFLLILGLCRVPTILWDPVCIALRITLSIDFLFFNLSHFLLVLFLFLNIIHYFV